MNFRKFHWRKYPLEIVIWKNNVKTQIKSHVITTFKKMYIGIAFFRILTILKLYIGGIMQVFYFRGQRVVNVNSSFFRVDA